MFGWLLCWSIDERGRVRLYHEPGVRTIGGALGGWLFGQLGIQWGGVLGQLGTAIIGAVAILWIASLIKK